jgi:hypothetical protein
MTIEAELFDGTVLEFPPGTSPDVIQNVVRQQTAQRKAAGATAPQSAMAATATDVAKAVPSGLAKGVAGLAGLPGAAQQGYNWVYRNTLGRVESGVRSDGQNWDAPSYEEQIRRWGGAGQGLKTGDQIQAGIEKVTGPLYKPQTVPGQYAGTIAEFIPGMVLPGGTVGQRAAMAVVPALASETAGQVTQGTAAEPYARLGGALAGGLATAGVQAMGRRPTNEALRTAAGPQLNRQVVEAAAARIDEAAAQGITVTWDEALNQVTNGAVNLGGIRAGAASRPEGAARFNEVMSQRAGQIEAAARQQFDNIGTLPASPSGLADDVSAAARGAVMDTPQGRALFQAEWAAGPRVTPEQAGQVIQPELRRVYEGREGMRAALADQDYGAARNAPATIPLDGGFGFRNVTKHNDGPEIPILLDPAERQAAIAARQAALNQTERMPVVGLRPTQFGQVDASSVLQTLDAQLATAKGSVRDGLTAARRALMDAEGNIDNTVAGLHNSRVAITDLIDQAKRAGANGAVRELEGALGTLDQALERVPAYGQARRNFEAASRPLEPFREGSPIGSVVQRDQYGKRFEMASERVPGALDAGGASTARAFGQVASSEARRSYEQYLVTQVLDRAGGQGLDVSASAIRAALRQNEDALAQFPGVRDRLTEIAASREALDKLNKTPIGRLAQRDVTTKQAVEALFPTNPLPGSAGEVGSAVAALVKQKPVVANQLIRQHAEMVFNDAAEKLQGGLSAYGGANFAAKIAGNSQQAQNLEAAITAARGPEVWKGFRTFLDILETTGKAARGGSNTADKLAAQDAMKSGKLVGEIGNAIATGGIKVPGRIKGWYEQVQMGKNSAQLADILIDPKSAALFRRLADESLSAPASLGLATRLTYMGERAFSREPTNAVGNRPSN